MRRYFMTTERIGFSKWQESDNELAVLLWGDEDVTRYICASGKFSLQDIETRLKTEVMNEKVYHIQYWPIFALESGELIGCCGIRPFKEEVHAYEMGFHLRKKYWGKGLAYEAATNVTAHSFMTLNAEKLYAGHHPEHQASQKLLLKLGFKYIGDNYYEPTGLYHPSYEMENSLK